MSQGFPGVPPNNHQLAAGMRHLQDQLRQHQEYMSQMARELAETRGAQKALSGLSIEKVAGEKPRKRNAPMCKAWGGQGYVSVDEIPGRVIPQDFLVDIPIAAGEVNEQPGNILVTMEGPFVATARVAIYRSDYTFRYQSDNGSVSAFNGRSNGRFRPISSNSDIMDAIRAFEQPSMYQPSFIGAVYDSATPAIVPVDNPLGVGLHSTDQTNLIPNFPGSGRPLNPSPLAMSAFRTMSFDALIAVEVAGANFPRQNIRVPSAFWTKNFGEPVELGALDVFEPGDSVTVKVTPTHPSNPAYGNVRSLAHGGSDYTYSNVTGQAANNPFPAGPFPFIAGQYDGHEGINDETLTSDSSTTSDRVTRAENGVLTIGYMGYRIVQPPQSAA